MECGTPDVCVKAEEVAELAVKRVFAILGVDIDKPEAVEEFRKDLRSAGSMRRAGDKAFLSVIGAVALALCAALGAGIVVMVRGQ